MHLCFNSNLPDDRNSIVSQITDGYWAAEDNGYCLTCGGSTIPVPARAGHDPHMPLDQEQFRVAFQTLEAVLSGIDSNIPATSLFNMADEQVDEFARLILEAAAGLDTADERLGVS